MATFAVADCNSGGDDHVDDNGDNDTDDDDGDGDSYSDDDNEYDIDNDDDGIREKDKLGLCQ